MDRSSMTRRAPHVTSRRTLVRGAAWTVPAVSLVAATPAFAGTTGGLPTLTSTFTASTNSDLLQMGDGDLTWKVANAPVEVGTVFTITAFDQSGGNSDGMSVSTIPTQFAGPEGTQYFVNGSVTFTYTVTKEIPIGDSVTLTMGATWVDAWYHGTWSVDRSNSSTGTFRFSNDQWTD